MAKVRDYRVWAAEEEDALRMGVAKHGIGAWEIIRQDPAYRSLLMCAPAGATAVSGMHMHCARACAAEQVTDKAVTRGALALRSDRTGVQLKDKWRNLVKFKHVSRSEVDSFRGASFLSGCACAALRIPRNCAAMQAGRLSSGPR